MSTFPSILTAYTNPTPTSPLNAPSHSGIEIAQNSGLSQLEATIGLAGGSSTLGTVIGDLRSPASNGGGHVQSANTGGTGQTSFNKGDILAASSTSVLSKLAVGTDGSFLVADSTQTQGMGWSGGNKNVQSFVSSGTWVKPNIGTTVFIELWGGGGSGGHINSGKTGGGGGGSYVPLFYPIASLLATETVTIGQGGAAVQGTNSGNTGGITVFSARSVLTAYGGAGGFTATSGVVNGGGGGGITGNGSSILGGNPGSPLSGNGGTPSTVGGMYSGGGGGTDNAGNPGNIGATLNGGGGGASGVNGRTNPTGGISLNGGNGGGSTTVGGSVIGGNGSIMGGGGGGGTGSISGAGGNGYARITTF